MASYDVTNEAGKVRLLISDIGGQSGADFIFEDNEIEAFLEMRESIGLAAALALKTMAANTALVMKVIKFMELTTNGAETAKALRETAESLEKADENDEAYIDIISMSGRCYGELAEWEAV